MEGNAQNKLIRNSINHFLQYLEFELEFFAHNSRNQISYLVYSSCQISGQTDKMPRKESKYKIKMVFLNYFPLYFYLCLKIKDFFHIPHF